MAGKITASLTAMLTNIKINMRILRTAILAVFVLSIAVTALAMVAAHNPMLHMAHVVLISLTFLLIALYLVRSAEIASLRDKRELTLRIAMNPELAFVAHILSESPLFNVCAGVMAKYGVYIRSAQAMSALASCNCVAVEGDVSAREGYAATKATLEKMGVTLSDDASVCPVRITLGPFMPGLESEADIALTRDKIAYLLVVTYVSRLYARYSLLSRVLLICSVLCVAGMIAASQFTYAAMIVALWPASTLLIIRRIERLTERLTFNSVANLKMHAIHR